MQTVLVPSQREKLLFLVTKMAAAMMSRGTEGVIISVQSPKNSSDLKQAPATPIPPPTPPPPPPPQKGKKSRMLNVFWSAL